VLAAGEQDTWPGKSTTPWLPWQKQQGLPYKINSLVQQDHCHPPLVLAVIPWRIFLQAVKVSPASGPLSSCCHGGKDGCTKCSTHARTLQSSLHWMKALSLARGRGTAQIAPADSADDIYQRCPGTKVPVSDTELHREIRLWRHLAPLRASIYCGLDNPSTMISAHGATWH